ncbi:alpha/beta fold hydrolase [Seonamhaeicola sp.]|uniref:alpha/beta fold hydrolase n=1 Tax=Seonamhaeicola sp. TaxID=1912245 RepID=UPI00262BF4BE|nr:alpha/beta fold hydrolase [Seonamhaeicola sp.]
MKYFADSNGIKICYQIRGTGEPLVLLMGFGADGNTWEKHVAVYQKHFKCILIDNRGVGESDQPKGPYSTKTMADDAIAVMDHAGIFNAKVAGISMGGAIAQELALHYPERVLKLVLISTWPRFNNYTKVVYENLKKIRVTSKPGDFMELLQLWIFAPPFYETALETLKQGQDFAEKNPKAQSQMGFEGQLDACINHDTISRLKHIAVPTLITVGERDIFTPPEFSRILHKGIENSIYESFPTGGHVHHWEDLDRFNELTTQFLIKD